LRVVGLKPKLKSFNLSSEISCLPKRPVTPVGTVKSVRGFNVKKLRRAGPESEPLGKTHDPVANPQASGPLPSTEKIKGSANTHEFQAETRKILDIVAKSLYSEKEVFVRELVSNASDALEKARQYQITGAAIEDPDIPFEIKMYADRTNLTLTIQDTGVGMKEEELINNLGSIGHSGSLDFVNSMKEQGKSASASDIIGQFGVGFYSVFMVADDVTVYSKSVAAGSKGYAWQSDGSGKYTISEADGVSRGTKIVIKLNKDNTEFSIKDGIERILKKYSNFVGFPISLNGKQVNTVKPLWAMDKKEITPEQHKEFFRFITSGFDAPFYHLHYSTDSPIDIRSIFYVGEFHGEKFGMARLEPKVSLYTRKVLIKSNAKVLPDWLRFVSGVIDSEDLPLNLSRENFQDSALVKRIGLVCTRRILKFFIEESKRDPVQYKKFYAEYGNFLKEGMVTDVVHKDDLVQLAQFESSTQPAGSPTTLLDYISRSQPNQTDIYYLVTPSRKVSEESPYIENFKEAGVEVLLCYSNLDDFVMNQMKDIKGRRLLCVSTNDAAVSLNQMLNKTSTKDKTRTPEQQQVLEYLNDALLGRASKVTASDRLVGSPAVITDHGSLAYRKMMKMVNPDQATRDFAQHQELEVNLNHPIIQKVGEIRMTDPALAKLVTEQIYDEALISAGLMEDAREMLPRLKKITERALGL